MRTVDAPRVQSEKRAMAENINMADPEESSGFSQGQIEGG